MTEKEHLSWEEFGAACKVLAQQIIDSGFEPEVVLAVARGGLPLAGAISYCLGVKACASINVEFYTGDESGATMQTPLILTPALDTKSLVGKRILIADDVAETGATLRLVRDEIGQIPGTEVRVATVYKKPQSSYNPDYVALYTSKWIVFPWNTPILPSRT